MWTNVILFGADVVAFVEQECTETPLVQLVGLGALGCNLIQSGGVSLTNGRSECLEQVFTRRIELLQGEQHDIAVEFGNLLDREGGFGRCARDGRSSAGRCNVVVQHISSNEKTGVLMLVFFGDVFVDSREF